MYTHVLIRRVQIHTIPWNANFMMETEDLTGRRRSNSDQSVRCRIRSAGAMPRERKRLNGDWTSRNSHNPRPQVCTPR